MSTTPFQVVIAGGGVAGLETLLALRTLAGSRPHIRLVTDQVETVERAATVAEPFDRGVAPRHDVAAIADDQDAELSLDRLVEVPPGRRVARLASGRELAFDALVVATGARQRHTLDGAIPFAGGDDVHAVRAVRDELVAGSVRSAAFVLAAPSAWPLPAYELALMTGADLVAARVAGAQLTIVTPEPAPLALFGPSAASALAPLLAARGVAVRADARPVAVQPGRLLLADGSTIAADRVVALPVPAGRPPAGLPSDGAGFVTVDRHGRVPGASGVYAAGDVTAFPLKQGGLAAQQADVVAEAIAAQMGLAIEPRPLRSVVRGMLLIGGVPLYLRTELGEAGGGGQAGGAEVAEEGGPEEGGPETLAPPPAAVSAQALWWPPAKVAARYLGAYLATARPSSLADHPLTDR